MNENNTNVEEIPGKRNLARTKLARNLSEIMNNPETPVTIYDALGDVICFYASFLDYNSTEIIEMSLQAFDEKGNGQEPEITSGNGFSVIM